MKRWRAKNPRPQPQQAHAAKKSNQPSRTRDGRPKRRDRVATNDDDWVSLSLLSSDTPCAPSDSHARVHHFAITLQGTLILQGPRRNYTEREACWSYMMD